MLTIPEEDESACGIDELIQVVIAGSDPLTLTRAPVASQAIHDDRPHPEPERSRAAVMTQAWKFTSDCGTHVLKQFIGVKWRHPLPFQPVANQGRVQVKQAAP